MNVAQPLLDLDSVSRALYQAGHGPAAVVLRGAFNALRSAGVVPSLADIKDCPVKEPRQWVADNGYHLLPSRLEIRPRLPDYLGELLDERWLGCLGTYAATLEQPVQLVHGQGMVVCSFGWPHSTAGLNERFDLFSASYDLMVPDRFWVPVPGHGIFSALDQERWRMLVDLTGSPLTPVAQKAAFIGSIRNWGHWLLDHLARTALLPDLPDRDQRKLVFGPLSPRQREGLEIFGVAPDEVMELETRTMQASRFQFDDLILLPGVPYPAGYAHLRKGFQAAADTGVSSPELVFISRRRYAPRHRISNLDEVEAWLRAKGFFVADDLAALSLREQAGLFRNTRVVVLSLGADLATLSMCPPSAAAVMLTPDRYARLTSSEIIWREAVSQFFQDVPVVPLLGESVSADASVEALAHYDVSVLEQAIEFARALGARR